MKTNLYYAQVSPRDEKIFIESDKQSKKIIIFDSQKYFLYKKKEIIFKNYDQCYNQNLRLYGEDLA